MIRVSLVSAPTKTDLENQVVLARRTPAREIEDCPLGILALAAALEQDGFMPYVVDLNCWYVDFLCAERNKNLQDYSSYAALRLAELDCSIIGFGTICSSYPLTVLIAQELKRLRPTTTVLFGGPQASVVDLASLQNFPFIDLILRGEADHTLPLLVNALGENLPLDAISSLTYRRDKQVVRNPEASLVLDLDSLPLPAFHLYPGMTTSRILPLEHGRGCPFSCTFCSTNDFFRRRFRLKSPGKVLGEMNFLKEKYGVDYFDLMHDMFTVDRKRVVEFCEAVLADGRTYHWGCSARTDCVDRELLELMASAGCVSIFYGVESGSPRIQAIIDKKLDIDEALNNVRLSSRCGMKTVASMIIGYPEEDRDDLSATLSFVGEVLRDEKVDPHLHLLAPLAGTPLYHRFRQQLVLEEVYTDISHNRLSQDVVERRLVAAYPEIFPNFYSVPIPHFERLYLQELREFLVRTICRFRWSLAAWYDRCGDLLNLFEEWKQWSQSQTVSRVPAELRQYYCSWSFDRDFIEFLASRPSHLRSRFEEVLLDFEQALIKAMALDSDCDPNTHSECPCEALALDIAKSDMRVALEKDVFLLKLNYDLKRAINLLKRGEVPDDSIHRPTKVVIRTKRNRSDSEVLEAPPAVANFLSLCDGKVCVDDVLKRFSSSFGDVDGIPAWTVAVHGLRTLYKSKLIRLLPATLPSSDGGSKSKNAVKML